MATKNSTIQIFAWRVNSKVLSFWKKPNQKFIRSLKELDTSEDRVSSRRQRTPRSKKIIKTLQERVERNSNKLARRWLKLMCERDVSGMCHQNWPQTDSLQNLKEITPHNCPKINTDLLTEHINIFWFQFWRDKNTTENQPFIFQQNKAPPEKYINLKLVKN